MKLNIKNTNKPLSPLLVILSIFIVFTCVMGYSMTQYVMKTIESNIDYNEEQIESSLDYSNKSIVELIVEKTDNLSSLLERAGIEKKDRDNIIKSSNHLKFANKLVAGKKIRFEFAFNLIEDVPVRQLEQVTYNVDLLKSIEINRVNEKFTAHEMTAQVRRVLVKKSTKIENGNFALALKRLSIAANNIAELTSAYSNQINFQREVKAGAVLNVIHEKFYTTEGKFVNNGKIIYASLNNNGKEYKVFNFQHKPNEYKYFAEDGKDMKREGLRNPLDTNKISSRFGYRKDPLYGCKSFHSGVDYKAAHGSKIYAAGDGVVKKIGWYGGYGKYILIEHNNKLSTAYGHASKFAEGLTAGCKVKKGQVIAFVGSTGKSTGPHAHFEVHVNGKAVDPNSMKLLPPVPLTGDKLLKFTKFKHEMLNLHKNLGSEEELDSAKLRSNTL